jgi:hypothetical protein
LCSVRRPSQGLSSLGDDREREREREREEEVGEAVRDTTFKGEARNTFFSSFEGSQAVLACPLVEVCLREGEGFGTFERLHHSGNLN